MYERLDTGPEPGSDGCRHDGQVTADERVLVGRLVLAATPIGDPADTPARLVSLLGSADLVAAEDTRRLRRLAAAVGVVLTGRVVSYHEHNEAGRTAGLVEAVRSGSTVLLVTDAGMPSVSDPGLRAVRAVAEAGLPVTAIPGPSAVLTALALSGLATDRFCFEGFLPRKPGERARALAALAAEPRTMVLFEAPHRLAVTLAAIAEAFGPQRRAAVCRELTKTYEEVRRGTLTELIDWVAQLAAGTGVRGEITVVVAGRPAEVLGPEALPGLVGRVLARVDAGERMKDAAKAVAAQTGAGGRALYTAAVEARAQRAAQSGLVSRPPAEPRNP